MPDDKNIQKEKLHLLLSYDEKEFGEAFQFLKQLDLSQLNYIECRPMLQIAQENKAWDYAIVILEKLLEKESNEKEILNLNLQLFTANFNLNRFQEVINLGEKMLNNDVDKKLLDPGNKEALLRNTIIACLERGKFDDGAFKKAKSFLENYPLKMPSFEYKAGLEAEVYLANNEVDKAFESIIEGVKIKKTPSSHEYVQLYFVLFLKIGNQIDLSLDSLEKVTDNSFVKLTNREHWYFIGDDVELDAYRISKTHGKYSSFIGKSVGDMVDLGSKYSSQMAEKIELIFSIEQYILWQSRQTFQDLGREGLLEGVDMIEVPEIGDTIDTKNLIRFMDDLHKRTDEFFEIYCNNNIPLSVLAISEGGLTSAVGRIQQEGKGFIHFSGGTLPELQKQKDVAKKILEEKLPFYIDGTSALFLSEIGMLPKIYSHVPNLKVSQSVLNLLAVIADKFRYVPGQKGYMGYVQGKITFSSVEKEKRDLIRSNFIASIKLLESDPKNISVISDANKVDCFSERKIPAELSDACILAQKENLPVMTDDYHYIQMNVLETKKNAPEYFSSLAFLRVLYDENLVSFDEYLKYFGYLSSYRFRFLSLNSEDIEKAVFGDGDIKVVIPENIRQLNFPLTLSEEYGVLFRDAVSVVAVFLITVLADNTVTEDVAERIFVEILETFPTKTGKKELGQTLLGVCVRTIENIKSKSVVHIDYQMLRRKVDKLLQLTEIYSSKSKLWTPNQSK